MGTNSLKKVYVGADHVRTVCRDQTEGYVLYIQACTVLEGSWDLVTTYNWAYNPTFNPPKWTYRGYPNYIGL